jgi:hypothetical protein
MLFVLILALLHCSRREVIGGYNELGAYLELLSLYV